MFDDDVYPHVALLLSDEGVVIDALQEEGAARNTLGKVIKLMQTKLCPNYIHKQASAQDVLSAIREKANLLQTVFSVLDAFKDRMSAEDCERTR